MKKFWFLLLLLSMVSHSWADEKIKLEEVVVTATRVEESVENVAQDVTIITGEELKKRSHTSIGDALKNVMGVNIRENGSRGAISSVTMRGSNAQQVLVLIDGKRLNKPGDGQVDLNTLSIPIENIERIEVLRGASSALYGSDAMGGVVNVITKIPSDPFTKISLSYGRFDTKNILLSTSRKVGNFGYIFSANREESSGFRKNSDYELLGFDSKFTFDLSKDFHIDLNFDHNHKEAGVPGSIAFPSPEARQWDENALYGVTFRFKDTIAKLYNHNSRIHFTDPAWMTDSTHKNHVLGADIQSSMLIGSSNLLTGGLELLSEEVDSTDVGRKTRSRKGLFIQDEITLNEKIAFNIGMRYDDFDKGNRITPRAGFLYKILKDTTVRLTAGGGYRIPTLNDLYWPDTGWTAGNPDLKPEKSFEYEASIEQRFSKKITVKALVFQKDVKDLIIWRETEPFRWMPENIDKAKIRGFELSSRLRMDPVNLEASYYYQDPENRNTDRKIYDIPRHQANGMISVSPFKDTTLSFEGRYVSNYVMSERPKWCYFVLNGKLSKKLPLSFGEGEIFIIGKNILDREYETSKGYPMPPVELTGGISIKF